MDNEEYKTRFDNGLEELRRSVEDENVSLYFSQKNLMFYSLDCREGLMKKNKFVCLYVSGSKKHQPRKSIEPR